MFSERFVLMRVWGNTGRFHEIGILASALKELERCSTVMNKQMESSGLYDG